MIVAMDGPAGCGKSTIAKLLSSRLGFVYINSGNIYRAISLAAIERKIGLEEEAALVACASSLTIDCDASGAIILEGRKVEAELRSAAVDAIVAQVSAIPEIRAIVN
ncbi:MAG: (d)CMP kinase, partial [Rectinemataceae bacterium]